MKKILAALAVAPLALALTACVGPPDLNPPPFQSPLYPMIEAPVEEELATPEEEAMAKEFAYAICGVLDEYGVVNGLPLVIDTGTSFGYTAYEVSQLSAAAILYACPEYETAINSLASSFG